MGLVESDDSNSHTEEALGYSETDDEAREGSIGIGNVLRGFRHDHRISILELQKRLDLLNYPIDTSTLTKYETGSRRFPAYFIPFVAEALELSDEEQQALLNAYMAELSLEVATEYLNGKQRLQEYQNTCKN